MPKDKLHLSARQRARNSNPDPTQWLPWSDCVQRIFEVDKSWHVVLAKLIPKLKSRQVQSLVRAVHFQTYEIQDHELPPKFWEEVKVLPDPGLPINTTKWLAENRAKKRALPDWWLPNSWHHFYLNHSQLDRHFPSAGEQGRAAAVGDDRRRTGPEPRHNWKLVVAGELFRQFAATGQIPTNDHRTAREMLKFCYAKWKWEPSDAAMRKLLKDLLKSARNLG